MKHLPITRRALLPLALLAGLGAALAGLEFGQLLGDVFRVLRLQDGVGRQAARAVGRVAGQAGDCELLALGSVGHEGRRLGFGQRGAGEQGRQGQDLSQLHAHTKSLQRGAGETEQSGRFYNAP